MVIRRRLRKDDDLVLHPFSSFCPGDRFNGLLSILCGSLNREPVSFESLIETNDSKPSPIISASQGRGKRTLPTETIPSSQETNGFETPHPFMKAACVTRTGPRVPAIFKMGLSYHLSFCLNIPFARMCGTPIT